MSLSTRDLLKRHTADIVRPRWGQHEAALGNLVTTAHDPEATDEQAEAAARQLVAAGARQVLLTLGGQGLLQVSADSCQHHPATPVKAVDTTAAGDTFLGGFAAGLAEGLSVSAAIALGQQAAAIAVTRPGAQPSIPTRQELAR